MEMTISRAEMLARQLEDATETLLRLVEPCTETQWQALCPPEERSVGVMVHHIATEAPVVAGWSKTIGNGQPLPVTMEMVHASNAQHTVQNTHCNKAETLDLLRQNSAKAAAIIRNLSDEQLDRTVPVALFGGQPVSAQKLIEMVLIGHVHGYPHSHLPNIRNTLAT